jgi:hypothetical protein
MKLVTEFASFTIAKGLKTKATLLAEGKSPEDVQAALGESFKFEGDKLKHFVQALEVGALHSENLKRVVVMTLAEGETVPAKATKVEETHYVPEFLILTKHSVAQQAGTANKGGGRGKGRGDSKKGSPWGLTPEEKAAKGGNKAAAKTT